MTRLALRTAAPLIVLLSTVGLMAWAFSRAQPLSALVVLTREITATETRMQAQFVDFDGHVSRAVEVDASWQYCEGFLLSPRDLRFTARCRSPLNQTFGTEIMIGTLGQPLRDAVHLALSGTEFDFVWSPDAAHLLIYRQTDQSGSISVISTADFEVVERPQIAIPFEMRGRAVWSVARSRVLLPRFADASSRITHFLILNADDSRIAQETPLVYHALPTIPIAWSIDQRAVVYASTETPASFTTVLIRLNLETNTPAVIAVDPPPVLRILRVTDQWIDYLANSQNGRYSLVRLGMDGRLNQRIMLPTSLFNIVVPPS